MRRTVTVLTEMLQMRRIITESIIPLMLCILTIPAVGGESQTAAGRFKVDLPPHQFAGSVRPDSPFGINTAFGPETSDLHERLELMQQAGIKWGRQDFNWKRIEREEGKYDWEPYDRLIEICRQHGLMLFGNLAYNPAFHDPRTPEGVEAYCAFARAAAQRYKGRIDHWQIWNEPT